MIKFEYLIAIMILLPIFGCGGGGGGSSDEGEAQTDPNQFVVTDTEQYFAEHISPKIIQKSCITCHISSGVAKDTPLNYVNSSVTDHTDQNRQLILDYFAGDSGNAQKYLQKVQGQLDHGGRLVLNSDSDEYKMLEAWVQAVTQ